MLTTQARWKKKEGEAVEKRGGRFHADHIVLVAALVLAAIYFYATEQFPVLEVGDPLGPKAFPRLLGAGLLIAAAMLFFEMRNARRLPENDEAEAETAPASWGLLAAVAVWTCVYFALFERLGYVLATTGYLLALMAYFNRGRWAANLFVSAGFSVLSYLMFNFLGTSLPQGLLPF